MALQALKAVFCGPAGCCVRTSLSDSDLDPTYKQFNDIDVVTSTKILSLSNNHGRYDCCSNRNPHELIEEIELKNITSPEINDEEEMPTWRGDELCDLHQKSVRRRRIWLSLSNLIDLTEPETNISAFSLSTAEKRSTFPPSRRKNENITGKRINNSRNAAEFYQIAYSRLQPEEYDQQETKSSSTDNTSISSLTTDSSFDWQYDNLNSHRCFEICTDSEMEKNCERKDLVVDSYTLYNVIRCPMCKVTNTSLGKPENQQLVRLYI